MVCETCCRGYVKVVQSENGRRFENTMQFENATTTAFRENIPEADFVDPRREHEADAAKIVNVPRQEKVPVRPGTEAGGDWSTST